MPRSSPTWPQAAIYVVVPVDGELVIAKGGVFSYYEFPWPAADRLTDEKWRGMLDNGQAPALPEWTASFRVEETEEVALRGAVWQYITDWILMTWWPQSSRFMRAVTGEAQEQSQAYIQSLEDTGHFEGFYLVRLEFLSLDLQDSATAIVTTRETWWGERYKEEPGSWPGTLVATRPEYTIGVVYHLVRGEEGWLVSRVLLQGERPAWQEVKP
jgi:hypothetical protein